MLLRALNFCSADRLQVTLETKATVLEAGFFFLLEIYDWLGINGGLMGINGGSNGDFAGGLEHVFFSIYWEE